MLKKHLVLAFVLVAMVSTAPVHLVGRDESSAMAPAPGAATIVKAASGTPSAVDGAAHSAPYDNPCYFYEAFSNTPGTVANAAPDAAALTAAKDAAALAAPSQDVTALADATSKAPATVTEATSKVPAAVPAGSLGLDTAKALLAALPFLPPSTA
ncbi:MAG: hypothetical protein J3R72DRAFT_423452 [Linnemannia gamsii]|nr:MAG: hypothetical protein J3R72DRAFT_423452 [Linnemannia gamsii]